MLLNRLWVVLVLLIILIISVVYKESFINNERSYEESDLKENSLEESELDDNVRLNKHAIDYPGKYQVLDDTLDYLNNYSSDLKGYSNKVDSVSKDYLRNRKPNQIISNSKARPISAFETLDYNKALLSAIQLQSFEDRYLYKVNEKLNY